MKFQFFVFLLSTFLCIPTFAQTYTWTGNGDGVSLYQEENWEFNKKTIPQINPNTPISTNLLVDLGTVGGNGFNGDLLLGGNSLTIYGGVINGKDNIGSFALNTKRSALNLYGGNTTCKNFKNLTVFIDNDAELTLTDNNSLLENTKIDFGIDFQGIVTFSNIDIENFRTNLLSKFMVNGTIAIEGTNVIITNNGNRTQLRVLNPNSNNGNKDYSDSPIANGSPNIVYILLDDLAYGDLGILWQNNKEDDKRMLTPHLDNFAIEGATLTNHYASAPVCAPSRASFLDGLHQGHSSIRNNQFDKPIKKGLTIAELLSKAGYRTMHVGKYGTGGGRTSGTPSHPLKIGFDQFYGFLFHSQGHIHYPQNGTTNKESYFTDGYKKILEGTELTYTTDVFTAKSKQWIINHKNTRPEQPFFLYLAYDVPHSALDVPTTAYPNGGGLTGGLQWTSSSSNTPWVNTAFGERNAFIHPDYASKNWTNNEKKYATMVRRVDNAIHDMIQLLKDLNIDNETLIVFTSDNGAHKEGGYNPQSFESYANFNGIKRDLWEGGIRMPTLCRFPETIPSNAIVNYPSGQWDWYATFSELAGVPTPINIDGVSLLPALKNETENQIERGYLYHEYTNSAKTPNYQDFEPSKRDRIRNQMQVIRIGDFKGIRYNIKNHSDAFEIYNIATDPRESENLAANMPLLEQQMRDKTLQIRKKNTTALRPYDNELIPSINLSNTINGLFKYTYNSTSDWVPNFTYLTPNKSTVIQNINSDDNQTAKNLGLFYTGYINIPTDGRYTFYVTSSSKCHLMLHDIHLIDNDFNYTNVEISEELYLKSGLHPIKIFYQQNNELIPDIQLKMDGPGISKMAITNEMFYIENTLSSSSFNVNNSIEIFPNPTKNKLYISFLNDKRTITKLSVFSLVGQKIIDLEIQLNENTKRYEADISNLNSGMYLFKVYFSDGVISTKKIVKL